MSKVEIYSTQYCPYCIRAKKLLDNKNAAYTEYRVDQEPQRLKEMINRSQRRAVPQIFINDYHVGGCDELFDLEAEDTLDSHLDLCVRS